MLTHNYKGTYVLVLHARKRVRCQVGKIGALDYPAGYYLYVGSAFGPGGVAARVNRHLNEHHRMHWHVDYLNPHTQARAFWYSFDTNKREHQWAQGIATVFEAQIPMTGFGCSDCNCRSHLYYLSTLPEFEVFEAYCLKTIKGHQAIYQQHLSKLNST